MNKVYLGIGVVIVAGFIAWSFQPDKAISPTNNTQNSNQNGSSNQNQDSVHDSGIPGTLKVSDKSSRGNLMVVTDTQTIYIRTSRDYSALVNHEVTLTIDGSVTNFSLLDIVAR